MSNQSTLLEVCANSLDSAIQAQKGGAHRIELCSALELGGLTPSVATIELTRQHLEIPVFVLIRPRAGDFCYSLEEWQVILRNIHLAKNLGVDGIVCGALKADGHIDIERTKELIAASRPLPFTFHRAFDRCPDPLLGLQQLMELGVDRVLSSGQESSAMAGRSVLKEMVAYAGSRIMILGGAGINSQNVKQLIVETGLREVHLSGKKKISKRTANVENVRFNQSGNDESEYWLTDYQEIEKVRLALQ